MSKLDRLATVLDSLVVYDFEGDEWTLDDMNPDAGWAIEKTVVKYLSSLKVPVPKPVFGDTSSIEAATRNRVIDDLLEIIEEGES
jgi:hypothetical protein